LKAFQILNANKFIVTVLRQTPTQSAKHTTVERKEKNSNQKLLSRKLILKEKNESIHKNRCFKQYTDFAIGVLLIALLRLPENIESSEVWGTSSLLK